MSWPASLASRSAVVAKRVVRADVEDEVRHRPQQPRDGGGGDHPVFERPGGGEQHRDERERPDVCGQVIVVRAERRDPGAAAAGEAVVERARREDRPDGEHALGYREDHQASAQKHRNRR